MILTYLLVPRGQNIGNYRYTPIARDARAQVWSPDGKAFAYASTVNGTAQVFLRYLNSPVPFQLTHEKDWVFPKGWSSDGSHVIVVQFTGGKGPAEFKLSSVATVGGNLEFIMYFDCDNACEVSPDSKVFATHTQDKDGNYVVEVSDPLGSPFRTYMPSPFERDPALSCGRRKNGRSLAAPLSCRRQTSEAHCAEDARRPFREGSPSFSWLPETGILSSRW